MITLNELQEVIAEEFLDGDVGIAGMCIFCAVMGFIFLIFGKRSLTVPFAIMLPVTLIFTSLNVLPESLTILLVIVSVLGLGMAAREKLSN